MHTLSIQWARPVNDDHPPIPASETPDTVTDAVQLLARLGYAEDLNLVPGGIGKRPGEPFEPVECAIVDYQFRFEGPSDPADEAIVLGVHCPTLGIRGVVVSAFGPSIDPEHEAVLRALLD
jgi:hypothetical protein